MWSNLIDAEKISSMVLSKFSHIRISISWSTNQARNWFNKNIIDRFSLLLNKYISNVSNIYNLGLNLILASQKICEHMLSNLKSDHIYSYFWLRIWFTFCFFSYVVIFHLIWRREGAGIYCPFIPNWIKLTRSIILFTAQYRTGIQNQVRNTTWRIILKQNRIIRHQVLIYLDSLILTESWVFSPRVFSII